MKSHLRPSTGLPLASLAALLISGAALLNPRPARADSLSDTFLVQINTTALSGESGNLAFDLIGEDKTAGNNLVTADNFATVGTSSSLSVVSLTDADFFNEQLDPLVYGSQLSFTLNLTDHHAGSPSQVDEFSFFLLDNESPYPDNIADSTDPTGADALFTVDLTGTDGGNLSVFSSTTPGVSWTVTAPGSPVPEAFPTVLGLLVSLTVLGWWARPAVLSCRACRACCIPASIS